LDGKGLAVSEGCRVAVNVTVDVTDIVWVAIGATVFVTDANDVLVGALVSTTVGGTGVDIKVQANNVIMDTKQKIRLRLIVKLSSPCRILYLNKSSVKGSPREKKSPSSNGDFF
jgi:hypothetical protein